MRQDETGESNPDSASNKSSRRDFLAGRSLRGQIERAGDAIVGHITEQPLGKASPESGPTVRLATRAMACEFCVIQNPGGHERTLVVSDALDLIHSLEAQMTVYREDSELSAINRSAGSDGAVVESELFSLLRHAVELSQQTDAGFDPTTGPLVSLWSDCRMNNRIPTQVEIDRVLMCTGSERVRFDEDLLRIEFDREGVELNLGGIGKGYALDVAGQFMRDEGVDEWLFHAGHSSLLARGDHNQQGGWPVGIRNPLFTEQRLASIVLQDMAMSTSGSNVQFFRYNGQRYGHILDPQTGWPVDGMLSVTVIAPTAAEADALSTAFFVRGVEIARQYCDNHPTVGALLIPPTRQGRKLNVFIHGIPSDVLFFHTSDINIIREG